MPVSGIDAIQSYYSLRERWTPSDPHHAGRFAAGSSSTEKGRSELLGPKSAADPSKDRGRSARPATAPDKAGSTQGSEELSQEEQRQLEKLKRRDAQVHIHEQAHIAAGGSYVVSGPTYEYQQGPDGRRYAIGGEVILDISAVPGDPAQTILKMQTIKSAALAPAEPSGQDRQTASRAEGTATKARQELIDKLLEQAGSSSTTQTPKGSLIDQFA